MNDNAKETLESFLCGESPFDNIIELMEYHGDSEGFPLDRLLEVKEKIEQALSAASEAGLPFRHDAEYIIDGLIRDLRASRKKADEEPEDGAPVRILPALNRAVTELNTVRHHCIEQVIESHLKLIDIIEDAAAKT